MDKISYVSSSSYFDELRRKAREIDEGTDRLGETWKASSYFLIGGYAECAVETTVYLEELWQTIRSTNDAAEKFQLELELGLKQTDTFLEDSRAIYNDVKEQCDNINTVLTEYGYHYEKDGSAQKNNRSSEDQKNCSSLLAVEELSDVEVEFTPNLTWKGKAKSKRSDASNTSQRNSIKGIATPVIKSLASALQLEIPDVKGSLIIDGTPIPESKYRTTQNTSRK